MKHFIKDIIFLIIFFIILFVVSDIFVYKKEAGGSDVIEFYNLEENSLDMLILGSSHSFCTYSPDIIEEETGLNSYNFATQSQPIYLNYHFMVEALKTQKPKYVVLEAFGIISFGEYANESAARDAIDRLHWSWNKFEAINASVKTFDERMSYYFNIIKYHSRYNEMTLEEVKKSIYNIGRVNRGYTLRKQNMDILVDNDEVLCIKEKEKIPEKNLEYLNKIISLAEENDITLIVVVSPFTLSETNIKRLNWVEEYLDEKGIPYIDYNYLTDDLKFTYGDYYDESHVSSSGSQKISNHFSDYINSLEN